MHNAMHCEMNGHELVALAHLSPNPEVAEPDSYMFQSVGTELIHAYGECMRLPIFIRTITGSSVDIDKDYKPVHESGDEVEDLFELLSQVKHEFDGLQAVSVGAILSNYQRVRIENVCERLGLTCLSYLWMRDQNNLIGEMIMCGMNAVVVKVACLGLDSRHLGLDLIGIRNRLQALDRRIGVNMCGEGGEYETMTLDCPIFKSRIILYACINN